MTRHDALLVDLDGTVYAGPDAIPGAVEALEAARGRGQTVSYVTNNASRAPGAVSEHLTSLGLTVTDDDVVTSAQAGAAVLAQRCEAGARVLVVGTEALADEVRAVGLEPVRSADDEPAAVVQGHNPDTDWRQLAEASLALGRGATWVACNVDPTLPSDRGILLGNGSMVAALRTATGREPEVAGKPAAPLLRQAVERVGASTPLVVGDRLDTDIEGGHAVDAETLLVLTGVLDPRRRPRRPRAPAPDLPRRRSRGPRRPRRGPRRLRHRLGRPGGGRRARAPRFRWRPRRSGRAARRSAGAVPRVVGRGADRPAGGPCGPTV